MNHALRLEEASLRDPERIDVLARKLGSAIAASRSSHAARGREREGGASHGKCDTDFRDLGPLDKLLEPG